MKKEFKAPIVEIKELATASNIMLIGLSGDQGTKSANVMDDKLADGFKQWKGFGE